MRVRGLAKVFIWGRGERQGLHSSNQALVLMKSPDALFLRIPLISAYPNKLTSTHIGEEHFYSRLG